MSVLAKLFVEISAKGQEAVKRTLDDQRKALDEHRKLLRSGEHKGLIALQIALEKEQQKLAKEQDWVKRVAEVGRFRASIGLVRSRGTWVP